MADTNGTYRVQYAALPYRVRQDGEVQLRLVTSRETRRWVIPKGWPMKGIPPHKAAAREAYEEAGLLGSITSAPLGIYRYDKRLSATRSVLCEVMVFPMKVKRYLKKWPERSQRVGFWFSIETAASVVQEPELASLILEFGTVMAERHAQKLAKQAAAAQAKAEADKPTRAAPKKKAVAKTGGDEAPPATPRPAKTLAGQTSAANVAADETAAADPQPPESPHAPAAATSNAGAIETAVPTSAATKKAASKKAVGKKAARKKVAVKPETAKSKMVNPEVTNSEVAKSGAGKTEASKALAAKSGAKKKDIAKKDIIKKDLDKKQEPDGDIRPDMEAAIPDGGAGAEIPVPKRAAKRGTSRTKSAGLVIEAGEPKAAREPSPKADGRRKGAKKGESQGG